MSATKKTKASSCEETTCAENESGYRSSSFASCCSSERDFSNAECAHGVAQMNARTQHTTRVTVRCNCGFHNNLFIRGEGIPGLSWQRGLPMKCIKADEWVWETDKPFHKAEFKILVNDAQYEQGNNHCLDCGKMCTVAPRF